MPLIAIEGGPGSGKSTQTARLAEELNDRGITTYTLKLPNYYSPTGKKIKEYLSQDPTKVDLIEPWSIAELYARNRLELLPKLTGWLSTPSNVVVQDRSIFSNIVYQGLKMPIDKRQEFREQLINYEHQKLGYPQADLVIYLYFSAEQQFELVRARQSRGQEGFDGHEKQDGKLQEIHNEYVRVLSDEQSAVLLNCTNSNGTMLNPAEVTDRLIRILVKRLSLTNYRHDL